MLSLKPGYPGSPDMAARRKGIRVLISVCRSFQERMECRMPLVLFDWIITQLRGITPRELLSVFPPTKTYDGERYQCKDYFTTMQAVHKHGLDVPLGDRTFEFLYELPESACLTFRGAVHVRDQRCAPQRGQARLVGRIPSREGCDIV